MAKVITQTVAVLDNGGYITELVYPECQHAEHAGMLGMLQYECFCRHEKNTCGVFCGTKNQIGRTSTCPLEKYDPGFTYG